MIKENKMLKIDFTKVNKIVHKIFHALGTIGFKILTRCVFIYGIYEAIYLLFNFSKY